MCECNQMNSRYFSQLYFNHVYHHTAMLRSVNKTWLSSLNFYQSQSKSIRVHFLKLFKLKYYYNILHKMNPAECALCQKGLFQPSPLYESLILDFQSFEKIVLKHKRTLKVTDILKIPNCRHFFHALCILKHSKDSVAKANENRVSGKGALSVKCKVPRCNGSFSNSIQVVGISPANLHLVEGQLAIVSEDAGRKIAKLSKNGRMQWPTLSVVVENADAVCKSKCVITCELLLLSLSLVYLLIILLYLL